MSRLKHANHVGPEIHKKVDEIIADPIGMKTKVQFANQAFLLAKQLLADLPIVPTNERVYELTQEIEMGKYDDIGDICDAYDSWDAWKQRTMELLKAKGILVAKNKMHKIVTSKDSGISLYDEGVNYIVKIKNLPDASKKAELAIKEYLDVANEYVLGLADTALKYNLISEVEYEEYMNIISHKEFTASRLSKNLK